MKAFNSSSVNKKDIEDLLSQIQSCKSVSDVRVLKTKLLFIHGLVSQVSSTQILERDEYMGQYGKILKVTFTKVKENFYSAFVEFEKEEQAALALLALDNFLFKGKIVKVYYGSTKYCFGFLKGEECKIRQCAFSHKYERKYTYFKNNSSSIDHSKIAERILQGGWQKVNVRKVGKTKFPTPWKILESMQGRTEKKEKEQEMQEIRVESENNENRNSGECTSPEFVIFQEEWKELQEQITSFSKTEQDKKERKKTKVQEFLDYAEEKLHSLIFKSSSLDNQN